MKHVLVDEIILVRVIYKTPFVVDVSKIKQQFSRDVSVFTFHYFSCNSKKGEFEKITKTILEKYKNMLYFSYYILPFEKGITTKGDSQLNINICRSYFRREQSTRPQP